MTTRRHRAMPRAIVTMPRQALAAAVLAAGLALAGCGAAPQADPTATNPHGTAAPGAPASGPEQSGASANARDGVSGVPMDDARADQVAVAAAAERAASFGFTHQVRATDEEIARTREDSRLRQTNTAGTAVEPAECKTALTAVDWSPILLPGAGASRADFGSESFAGTGTVEVALEDPAVVEEHLANVQRLVDDCAELTMTVTDENLRRTTFDVTARASDAEGDSGLVWTRTPAGGGTSTTAQVLISRAGDHVVMVSFIGQPEVAGEEFTEIAEQVLAAAVESL